MSVTVIGDAFIDIIVPVQDIKPGETHHREMAVSCGGTATVAVQISKLSKKSKFVGKVGNDPFGEHFRQNLKLNRVEDLTFVDDENPTGLCTSLVYGNGERTMVANRGANDYLKKENIESCIDEITNSKIVYFSGYSLLSKKNSESVLYAIEECHRKNCRIYFNTGAPNLIKEDFKKTICDFVDVLILNIEEAKNMTEKNKIEDIFKFLDNIVDTVVITMGEDGCIVSDEKGYAHVKTEKLNVLDTTGAGDAFSAGFIAGKIRNTNRIECAKLGHKVAANFLKKKGGLVQ